jgi:threonine dehydrogenase-like Zn-dependent dehydrogenase
VAIDVVPSATQPVIDAVGAVRVGGTVVIGGVKGRATKVALDTDLILFREIRIQGVYSQGSDAYAQALRLLSENRYVFGSLHTHSFALEDAERAVRTLAGEIAGEFAVSVSLHPNSTAMRTPQ